MIGQEDFYYYKQKKLELNRNTNHVYLVIDPDVNEKGLREKLVEYGEVSTLENDNTSQTLNTNKAGGSNETTGYWAELNLNKKDLSNKEYNDILVSLNKEEFLTLASPYFYDVVGSKMALTQYFYVELKSKDDYEKLVEYVSATSTAIIGQNKFMPLWYTVAVTSKNDLNALQMANKFYESDLFSNAEPAFTIQLTSGAEKTPRKKEEEISAIFSVDTFFNDQWGLNNTGQLGGTTGIDINVENAWLETKGSPAIKVAVFDEGYELDHPDLQQNNIGTGYDTDSGSSPSVVWGDHGTACAGIVGAIQDNNIGVSGVAPRTSLISISINFSSTTYNKLADGINWAVMNDADIISNSWGGGTPSALFDTAVTNAFTTGRDGLGTVIVFLTHNYDGAVVYPSNSNGDIISVGAMSMCGERKSPTSCDGETWWGSNYGTELDVIAPGVNIPTTDIQGGSGYSTTDYTLTFNGTSSACPHVAGVAALMLAENPCLTHDQVEDIIELSANKVRTDLYTYSTTGGRPNGTWNNETGYGLVDAEAAVNMSQTTLTGGTSSFDIYSQDRPITAGAAYDNGTEPNPDMGPMWISEDIWVRQDLDGGTTPENPEYKLNSPNGIYVNVRNLSNTASSDCAMLKVYFSKASTGLQWPTHFNDYYQNVGSNSILHGDLIGSVSIPSIAPNGMVTVEVPWYPPNPADFTNDAHHFCLVSRIITPNDPMNVEVVGNVSPNVRNNNNIAWKNVSVYDITPGNIAPPTAVYIRGIDRKLPYTNIRFIDTGFGESLERRLFDIGNLVVDIDPELFKILKENGSLENKGIEIVDENQLYISSREAVLSKFPLEYGQTFSMKLSFKLHEELKEGEEIVFDLIQENAETREYVGGERFLIVNRGEEEVKEDDVKKDVVSTIAIAPNPNNGIFDIKLSNFNSGNYLILDIYGNVILKGEFENQTEISIDISKSMSSFFFVKVTSSDGIEIKETFIKK